MTAPEPLLEIPMAPEDARRANALLFGLIFNQSQDAERSWAAPYRLEARLGSLDPGTILAREAELAGLIAEKPALHRFPRAMATNLARAAAILVSDYDGDARRIWLDTPASDELLARLKAFPGIGPHKAMIGVFLLSTVYRLAGADGDIVRDIRLHCPKLYRQAAGATGDGGDDGR